MNLSFSNAINTTGFTYGYIYQSSYFGFAVKQGVGPVLNFMKNMRDDFLRKEGLSNDIAREIKLSTKMLDV